MDHSPSLRSTKMNRLEESLGSSVGSFHSLDGEAEDVRLGRLDGR